MVVLDCGVLSVHGFFPKKGQGFHPGIAYFADCYH